MLLEAVLGVDTDVCATVSLNHIFSHETRHSFGRLLKNLEKGLILGFLVYCTPLQSVTYRQD
ncbi:hypothetical protein QTP88_014817 [Uroleucon formosanum]